MKKLAMFGMAISVMMMLAGPASAARSETKTYGSPALGQGDLVSTCLTPPPPAGGLNSCVTFDVQPWDETVAVTITDSVGNPTYGTVGQDTDDDGLTNWSFNFCGTSPEFPVEHDVWSGTAEIIVFPHLLPGLGNEAFAGNPSPCVGVGTSGHVTAHFGP